MVLDFADQHNLNPPQLTPVFLYPYKCQRNQNFFFKNGMICTKNGLVVTYVGGDEPLVMMPPNKALKARQTFRIQLL